MDGAAQDPDAVSVRPAGPGDMAALAGLVLEMLSFYGTPPPLDETDMADALERDGPAGRGDYDCLIAYRAGYTSPGAAVGFAMFSPVYEAAFAGNGLFLRDIYVTEAARGQGAGKALMVAMARHCLARGYRRIDWHCDRLDLHARTFYELIAPDSFKLNRLSYRIENAEIQALADR